MLIKELMDSVDFESDHTGTTLTMVKKRIAMSKVTNTKIVEDIVVIATEGYLNKDLGEEIQNIAQKYIDDGSSIFLINLKDSKIVNSIGASILIELIEQLQDIDGQLVFCDLAPIIEKTFKIMGLTKYCKVYPTEDEAVKELA